MRVEFNDLGHLKHIVNLEKNFTVLFTEQGFYWYASKYSTVVIIIILFVQGYANNHTIPELPSSGAYVFRPLISEALPVSLIRSM